MSSVIKEAIHAIFMKMPKSLSLLNYIQDMDHRGLPLDDYYLDRDRRRPRTAFSPFDKFPPMSKTEKEVYIVRMMDCYYSEAANAEDDYAKIGLWRITSCFMHLMADRQLHPGTDPRICDIIKDIMDAENHRDDYGTVDIALIHWAWTLMATHIIQSRWFHGPVQSSDNG